MKILKAVVPWILTILLFVFLFSRIPVEKVLATLASADWGLYIAILVPYSGVYSSTPVLSGSPCGASILPCGIRN